MNGKPGRENIIVRWEWVLQASVQLWACGEPWEEGEANETRCQPKDILASWQILIRTVLNAGCDGHLLLGAQHCLHWLGDPPQPKSGQPSHPGQLNHHQQDAGCKQGDPDGYYPGGGVGVEPVGLLQHWLRLPHLLLLAHLRRSFLLLFDAHSDCDEKGIIVLVWCVQILLFKQAR